MIRTDKAPFSTVAISHQGMSGKNNEDRFAVSAFRLGGKDAAPVLLAVLSDGIGGHRAGEVAAEIAVESISRRVAESKAGERPTEVLRQAIREASEEIRRQAAGDPARKGMGATCAAALVIGRRLYIATVGDSRVYLLRNHRLQQISVDHTWIREALDAGVLLPEETAGHPNAHVIRRYLGSPTPPEADLRMRLEGGESDAEAEANQGTLLFPNDRLLLCTDGLTDVVEDAEILALFDQQPLEEAGQALVDLANQRGGPDNITLIGAQVPEKLRLARAPVPWYYFAFGCTALLALAGLFLIAVAGLGWIFGSQETPTPTPTRIVLTVTPLFQPLPGQITQPPSLAPATPTLPTPGPAQPSPTAWPTVTPEPPIFNTPIPSPVIL